MLALPLLIEATSRPDETINEAPCHILSLRLLPKAGSLLGIHAGVGELAVRKSDGLPARLRLRSPLRLAADPGPSPDPGRTPSRPEAPVRSLPQGEFS